MRIKSKKFRKEFAVLATYLSCKLVTNKQAVLDFNGTNHVLRKAHHHLLLLELLCMEHSLLLALHLLLVGQLLLVLLLGLLFFVLTDQSEKKT